MAALRSGGYAADLPADPRDDGHHLAASLVRRAADPLGAGRLRDAGATAAAARSPHRTHQPGAGADRRLRRLRGVAHFPRSAGVPSPCGGEVGEGAVANWAGADGGGAVAGLLLQSDADPATERGGEWASCDA